MLYIQVPDMNDSVSTLSIDGKEYNLRFTYNEKYDYSRRQMAGSAGHRK